MALMLVLMIMMLLSALMIGFMTSIMADTRSSGVDRDETQVYAVAHAGMEKLTSDLATLFRTDYSPNGTQISAVAGRQPVIAGFTYTDPDGTTGYKVQFTKKISAAACKDGGCAPVSTPSTDTPVPDDETTGTTIAAGPYQGFKGLVTHYNILVTAKSNSGGSEIRMRRELQTVAVPVFQFGVFSEGSLAFHSGSDFNFGGRVHTNGNLFIAGGNATGNELWLGDKVTAVGDIVRRYLDNGELSTSDYPGAVNMATGSGPVYRVLSATNNSGNGEGSVVGNVGSAVNSVWKGLSLGTYNGFIRNGATGAKRLDLPLVSDGAQPIDLIRRPAAGENTAAAPKPRIYAQRYYSQASLRILLSDTAANITSLPQVDGTPVSLENPGTPPKFGPATKEAPIATSAGSGDYKSDAGTSLLGGVIKIDMQKNDGSWVDVTGAVLAYGITGRNISNGEANKPGPTASTSLSSAIQTVLNGCLNTDTHPNAIIRLQRVKDIPSTAGSGASKNHCAITPLGVPSQISTDYWPNALWDAREGLKRDESGANTAGRISLGGVMYYVELDVNNLAKWFLGKTGFADGVGTLAKNDNNGYIVYFSDRRNNRNSTNAETGEYGNEDIINRTSQTGAAGGTLDACAPLSCYTTITHATTDTTRISPEDVNAYIPADTDPPQPDYTPVLDTYGSLPSYNGTANSAPPGGATPLNTAARPFDYTTIPAVVRGNRPIFFRRALKIVGGKTMLGVTGLTGLTIASENPVYVQGDYNVTSAAAWATEAHIASAIIADSITLLSNKWNDINSFAPDPIDFSNRIPSDTAYRFAAVTGKNISFPQPTGWSSPGPEGNFGMDGGAHNLLRQLEKWQGFEINYRGSIVSFYISRQATGIFKCCNDTYQPGDRAYAFDTDFLLPTKLPPGTPMFRDVNTLTFRQLLRPNQ